MPNFSSSRKDEEAKDRQQRGGEGHASQRGHIGKGLEERRHVFRNKSFDLGSAWKVRVPEGER